MARLFVGILVPEEIKGSITDFQSSLENMPMRIKLVEKKNLHLSLTFLGETQEEEIKSISNSLDEVCKNYKKFTVKVSGGMLIPNENYIRVIAFDAKGNNDVLENLRKDVVKLIGGDSYPVHLTLGRVRDISDKKLVSEAVKNCKVEEYFEVESVHLIKSIVTGRGPRYETVHESKLI